MELRTLQSFHFPAIIQIYAEGIETGIATFETKVPSWEAWNASHLTHCRLGIFDQENLLGWCALSAVSKRQVYSGVAELSIYIKKSARGKGIGHMLLKHLIECSESNGIWTLQAGIFSDNETSISLHLKCGFRKIGYREKIAQRNGKWYDNTLMERRSAVVGIN